jgi:hypothetical protein
MPQRFDLRVGLALLLAAGAMPAIAGDAAATAAAARTRVLRSWAEDVRVDGKMVPGRVDIQFDYDRGVATWLTRDDKGNGVESKELPPGAGQPRPTEEEFEEAKELVRADMRLGRVLRQTGAQMSGGFLLNEKAGKSCGPGSRCLQVQLVSSDGFGLVRWVVVDLVKRQIPYPMYSQAVASYGEDQR